MALGPNAMTPGVDSPGLEPATQRVDARGAGQMETTAASPDAGPLARVAKGVGALSLGAVINAVSQISIVPIALYAWGAVRYGEWVVLTGLVSLLKVTDLGLQTFVVNRLCASYTRGDRAEMQSVLHSALRVQLPMLGVFLALLTVTLLRFPLDQVLRLRTIGGVELFAVALLVAFEILIGVPMGVIAGLYRATGRLPRAALMGVVQQIVLVGLTLALIAGQTRFLYLAGTRVGIAILMMVWVLYDLGRLYPWLRIWPASGSWREGVRMIGPGLFFLLIPLADYLSSQFTLMVVQKWLQSGEVSRLATHRTMVNMAQMMSGLLTNAVWPELTALHARGHLDYLIRAHRSLAKFNLWLVGAIIFGLLPFVQWVYPSWTAGRLVLDSLTLALLMIRVLIWGAWSASMVVLLANNQPQRVTLALLGSAAGTSALSVILVPTMGMSGAALASLLGDLCLVAWCVPLLAARQIGDSFIGFLAEEGSALLKGIAIPVGFGLLAWFMLPSFFAHYFIVTPISIGMGLMFMWRQLTPPERHVAIHLYRWATAGRDAAVDPCGGL